MDRKITSHQEGFTLIELMIVIAIVGIIAINVIGTKRHATRVNQVSNDMHAISFFMKRLRLDAFTQKVDIDVTVGPTLITTTVTPAIGPQAGVASAGRSLTLNNSVLVTSSLAVPPPHFTISSRGNMSTGNIRLDYGGGNPPPPSTQLKYSCVVINNIRVRLGDIQAGACNAM